MYNSDVTQDMLADINSSFVRYYSGGKRRLAEKAQRYQLRFARQPTPLDEVRAVRSLSDDPSILFLCLGNICRSPMAERYLALRAEEEYFGDVTVKSAGFIPREHRESPDTAVDVAAEYGVDLGDHRSVQISEDDLQTSDAVFLMDVSNFRKFRKQFGNYEDVYFLGAFGSETANGFEIRDPHGGDKEAFRRAYNEIARSIESMIAACQRSRSMKS